MIIHSLILYCFWPLWNLVHAPSLTLYLNSEKDTTFRRLLVTMVLCLFICHITLLRYTYFLVLFLTFLHFLGVNIGINLLTHFTFCAHCSFFIRFCAHHGFVHVSSQVWVINQTVSWLLLRGENIPFLTYNYEKVMNFEPKFTYQ